MLSNQTDHATQTGPKLSKAESARINGAKSHGATTPDGKIRAANGNLKHGAYSCRVVMENEHLESYLQLYDRFVDLFQPKDVFEDECVTTLANTRWRIRRIEAAETANLDAAVLLNKPYIEARYENIDIPHERALAMCAEAANLERMTRVEERLHRVYERNLKMLSNYRRKSGRSMPEVADERQSVNVIAQPGPPEIEAQTPILTDPPTGEPAGPSTGGNIVSKVALFLVMFAMLLLTPTRVAAKPNVICAAVYSVDSFRSLPEHSKGQK